MNQLFSIIIVIMKSIVSQNDNFYSKIKHVNTLFQFIKNKKEDQFLDYI